MKTTVYNLDRDSVGEIDLADDVFGVEVNEDLLYEVLKAQLASKRKGSHKTKTRSEVRGSRRKIYRQKGTGRARHGAVQATQFVGGGIPHGPRQRDYGYRPPRKMRIGALRSALASKPAEGQLTIVDDFQLEEIKTKKLATILDQLEVDSSAVLVDERDNGNLALSARNLPTHTFLPPEGVNLYDVLRHEHLVLTKKAVAALEARLSKKA